MKDIVWFNGQFVSAAEASVSIFDGGLLHGAGLFETMRAENGVVFRLEHHLQRIRRSALRLLSPLPDESLPRAMDFANLLTHNNMSSARVRLTITAGPIRGDQEIASPTMLITASPLTGYPQEMHEHGITVAVCSFRTSPADPLGGHKTTSYFPRLLGLREAQQSRCTEAIWFTTSKHLAEGCISNVFVVRDGVLKTPPLDTPVLPGIARGLVLELASALSLKAEETPMGIDDLLDADEVFLTNSMMQVMPVVRVEKHAIKDARAGEMTRRIHGLYRETVRRECGIA